MRSRPFSWTSTLTKLGFRRVVRKKTARSYPPSSKRLRPELLEDRRMLAVITVDSLADNTINDGLITLREAIVAANNDAIADATEGTQGGSGDDEIVFDTSLSGGVITLNRNNPFGDLVVTESLKINASALTDRVTIDADDPTPTVNNFDGIRIFFVDDTTNGNSPPVFEIDSLSLINADESGDGGAIRSEGLVAVKNSVITGNSVSNRGGAIFVDVANDGLDSRSLLTIEDSIIEDNRAGTTGGAVHVQAGQNAATTTQSISISSSSVAGNSSNNGGGLYLDIDSATDVEITASEISGNGATSGNGGGVHAQITGGGSSIAVTDSDVDSNYANISSGDSSGGGIFVSASGSGNDFTIGNSSVSGNRAKTGGGMFFQTSDTFALGVNESLVSDNRATSGDGGGLFFQGDNSTSELPSLAITDSLFRRNRSVGSGGGIAGTLEENASVSIEGGTIISDNEATLDGGGIAIDFDPLPTGVLEHVDFSTAYPNAGVSISDTTIARNISSRDGGGALLRMGHIASTPSLLDPHSTAVNLPLNLERSIISGNQAEDRGGGLYLYGAGGTKLKVIDSRVTGNGAGLGVTNPNSGRSENPYSGGGIYTYMVSGPRSQYNSAVDPLNPYNASNDLVARLTIAGSAIDANTAGVHGGGVFICAKRGGTKSTQFALSNSTITGNVAGQEDNTSAVAASTGGGVHLAVFSGNEDEGLESEFRNVTVTENTAESGGGIYSLKSPFSGNGNFPATQVDTQLYNTVVSGNVDHSVNGNADNLYGSFNVSQSFNNLLGDPVVNQDPQMRIFDPVGNPTQFSTANDNIYDQLNNPGLAPLADNGGLTPTRKAFSSSPVIDMGANDKALVPFTTDPLPGDQRGFSRFVDNDASSAHQGTVDIGAYEYGLIVTETNDEDASGYGRSDLSIREALELAALLDGKNEIEFDTGTFTGHSDTIALTTAPLTVDSDVEIFGLGSERLTIDADGEDYVFEVITGAEEFTVRDLHLTDSSEAAIYMDFGNGEPDPQLSVDHLLIDSSTDGVSASYGGDLSITNTEIVSNSGIGVYAAFGTNLHLESSTVSENSRGVVTGYASSKILNSTISENTNQLATTAGFSTYFGSAEIVNSTIVNNRADANKAGGSTAVGGVLAGPSGPITMHNTIVAGNHAGAIAQGDGPADVGETTGMFSGQFSAVSSHNLIGYDPNSIFDTSSLNNITSTDVNNTVDPDLNGLAQNGGPTRTHALQYTSVAIDAGSDAEAGAELLDTEQRGFQRIFDDPSTTNGNGGAVDIGAYEFSAPIVVSSLADENDGHYAVGDLSLREALDIAGNYLSNESVVFDSELFSVGPQTILLQTGTLPVSNGLASVGIIGPGANLLTIDADISNTAIQNVFASFNAASFSLSGVRLTGANGSAISKVSGGGLTDISLDEVVIEENGAGLSASYAGDIRISRSEIADNNGTGVSVYYSDSLKIESSTIAKNDGQGITAAFTTPIEIFNTTVSSNETTNNNTAGVSIAFGSATIVNSTITANRSDANNTGGASTATAGVYANAAGSIVLHNSIVAGNHAGDSGSQLPADVGEATGYYSGNISNTSSFNLVGYDPASIFNTSTLFNITSGNVNSPIDPRLTDLLDHGGPTRTHALRSNSQAIGNGSKDIAFEYDLFGDQRSYNRFPNNFPKTDIGAFELAFDEFF